MAVRIRRKGISVGNVQFPPSRSDREPKRPMIEVVHRPRCHRAQPTSEMSSDPRTVPKFGTIRSEPPVDDGDGMRKHCVLGIIAIAGMLPALAIAHVGHGDAGGGLWAGILHPLSGLDHIVAMIALGILAAQLGAPTISLLPIAFPLVVALGGALGALGVPIPGVEVGIALSAITFGLMIALSLRAPRRIATSALLGLLLAAFAIFHGYAHESEIPESANAMSYAVGFVLATGLLHASGIALGVARRWAAGNAALRTAGFAIALCGVCFLIPTLASV